MTNVSPSFYSPALTARGLILQEKNLPILKKSIETHYVNNANADAKCRYGSTVVLHLLPG